MMKRYLARTLLFGLLVVMGVALFGCSPSSGQQSAQQAGPAIGAPAPAATPGLRTPMFPGLEGIMPDQLFDHFLGGQFSMTDKNNNPLTIKLIPGTVSAVTPTAITITPNGQNGTQTFNITPTTIVRGQPKLGSVEAIVAGDKVVIVTRDSTPNDATMIAKHGPMFHMQMMESMMLE